MALQRLRRRRLALRRCGLKGEAMAKKFRKGQKIFEVVPIFARIDLGMREIEYIAVVERLVDSCGYRRMTFAERGHDWIYGKSVWFPYESKNFYANIANALDYAASLEGQREFTFEGRTKKTIKIDRIFFGVFTDAEHTPFDEIQRIKNEMKGR